MVRGVKGTRRRDDIVDEATKLFAERGYAGASMADLAGRVGLRKASLFHHFASKRLLYATVLERPVAGFAVAIDRALRSTGRSFEDRLDELSASIVNLMAAQPYAARLLVREAMQWTAAETGPVANATLGVMNAAARFLADGQKEGAVAPGDPRQLVVSLIGVHLMALTIPEIVGRFMNGDPCASEAVDGRRTAVRAHVRGMVLRR